KPPHSRSGDLLDQLQRAQRAGQVQCQQTTGQLRSLARERAEALQPAGSQRQGLQGRQLWQQRGLDGAGYVVLSATWNARQGAVADAQMDRIASPGATAAGALLELRLEAGSGQQLQLEATQEGGGRRSAFQLAERLVQ